MLCQHGEDLRGTARNRACQVYRTRPRAPAALAPASALSRVGARRTASRVPGVRRSVSASAWRRRGMVQPAHGGERGPAGVHPAPGPHRARRPRFLAEQRVEPVPARVDVDQQRLDQQRQRDGQQRAEGAQHPAPEQQGDEGDRHRQADGVADEPRLDQRLDDEVQQRVDDDDRDELAPAAGQQAEQRGRHDAEDEADVGHVVGDEREQPPQRRGRHPDDRQGDPVADGHDRAEDGADQQVAAGALGEQGHARPAGAGARRPPAPSGGRSRWTRSP